MQSQVLEGELAMAAEEEGEEPEQVEQHGNHRARSSPYPSRQFKHWSPDEVLARDKRQERAMAEQMHNWGTTVVQRPRTSVTLRRIARIWDAEGDREDQARNTLTFFSLVASVSDGV